MTWIDRQIEAKKFLISKGVDLDNNIKPFKVIEIMEQYANEKVKEALTNFSKNVSTESFDWDRGEEYIKDYLNK